MTDNTNEKKEEALAFPDEGEEDVPILDDHRLFASAKENLPPGRFFRLIMWLYAERKMVMLSMMHFVATMVVWCKWIDNVCDHYNRINEPLCLTAYP